MPAPRPSAIRWRTSGLAERRHVVPVGQEPGLEQHGRHGRVLEDVEAGRLHAPVGEPEAEHDLLVHRPGEQPAGGPGGVEAEGLGAVEARGERVGVDRDEEVGAGRVGHPDPGAQVGPLGPVRLVAGALVDRAGHERRVAARGQEVVEAAGDVEVDVLLVDPQPVRAPWRQPGDGPGRHAPDGADVTAAVAGVDRDERRPVRGRRVLGHRRHGGRRRGRADGGRRGRGDRRGLGGRRGDRLLGEGLPGAERRDQREGEGEPGGPPHGAG